MEIYFERLPSTRYTLYFIFLFDSTLLKEASQPFKLDILYDSKRFPERNDEMHSKLVKKRKYAWNGTKSFQKLCRIWKTQRRCQKHQRLLKAVRKKGKEEGLKQTNRQTENQNIIIIHYSPYVTFRISFFLYLGNLMSFFMTLGMYPGSSISMCVYVCV